MKLLKIFSVFCLLHLGAWGGVHGYLANNPDQVLVVVDTSFSMKSKFPAMEQWIENFEQTARYREIVIGTDKAMLGKLNNLKSKSIIFRTAFGRMQAENLKRYADSPVARKILLSDGSTSEDGWELVTF